MTSVAALRDRAATLATYYIALAVVACCCYQVRTRCCCPCAAAPKRQPSDGCGPQPYRPAPLPPPSQVWPLSLRVVVWYIAVTLLLAILGITAVQLTVFVCVPLARPPPLVPSPSSSSALHTRGSTLSLPPSGSISWLLGYELWLVPNLWADDAHILELFTPLYTFEKGAEGRAWWRIGVVRSP